jgi:HK97 family phage major capsid protein
MIYGGRPMNTVTRMRPTHTQKYHDGRIDEWLRGGQEDKDLLSCAAWLAENVLQNAKLHNDLLQRGADLLPVEKASGIGINQFGGFLVPSLVADRIIQLRQAAGIMRRYATTWPIIRGDEMSVPRRANGVTVSFLEEGSTLSANDLSFDAVTLTPRKVGGFVRLSTEVESDSAVSWTAYLLEDFAQALADLEDNCGLNADGSATYGGMRGICQLLIDGSHTAGRVNAVSTHKTAATLTSDDLANLMAALPEQYWPNARLYMSAYMFGAGIARLAGAVGGNVDTAIGPSYCGIPISLTPRMVGSGDQAGKVMILLGDMSRAVALGSGRELTLATSTQRYLEQDQLAVRVTERMHLVAHSLGDNSTAGPICGLCGTT